MRSKLYVLLFLALSFVMATDRNQSVENPFNRERGPLVDLDLPHPLGGYEAIQNHIIYPDTALVLNLEGTVIIQCIIDIDGYPQDVMPILGPELLFDAAIAAVELSHWNPARLYREPVAKNVEFALDFHLPGSVMTEIEWDEQPVEVTKTLYHYLLGGVVTLLVFMLLGYQL